MSMNEREVETALKDLGLKAPRITPEMIDAAMHPVLAPMYHVFEGTTVTVCCIPLANGFTVVGESACASSDNFDERVGQKIAYDNARQKIWKLEGYRLRCALHEGEKHIPSIAADANQQ